MIAENRIIAPIFWRRLDIPGSERAELNRSPGGWILSGVVDVTHNESAWHLEYKIICADDWRTENVRILARNDAAVRIIGMQRGESAWVIFDDGQMYARNDLAECIDVDLGFSPSTNLLPIRRLDLAIGAGADVSATWVKFPEFTVQRLDQRYTRLAERTYLYESGKDFRRELTVDDSGFVVEYPGLWKAEGR